MKKKEYYMPRLDMCINCFTRPATKRSNLCKDCRMLDNLKQESEEEVAQNGNIYNTR